MKRSGINNVINRPDDDDLHLEHVKMAKSTHVQRVFDSASSSVQLTTDYSVDSKNISDAIMGKTVVKDDEKHRLLAITDEAIIELDDRIKKGVTIATQSILKKFKEKIENGTIRYLNIIETLTYIEATNAAFIETPEFKKVKSELNEILADMMKNGTPEEIEMAREGILGFFDNSKNNIVRGRKKFKNVPYAIQNSAEKEFLRAIFIGEMYEAGVFDFDFLEMSGTIDEMDFDIIDSVYRRSGLFTPEELEKAFYVSNTFEKREEILEYYLNNDKKYLINFATSEEIAKYIIAGKISPRDAIKRIRLETVKDFEPELLEEFLCVTNFPKGVEFIDYIQTDKKTEKYLNRKFLQKLDRERFLKVVLSDKIIYSNPYTSEDYINEYGKLTSDDMITLQENGLVEAEDLIKLTSFKSMQVQNPEEYTRTINNLLAFYDLDRLENLLKTSKLNGKFVELYNELLTTIASEEQRKLYFEKMTESLKEKENSDEVLALLVKKGLNIGGNIDYVISEEYISEAYLEDRISEKDIMKLYENNLISLETIRILYSDADLIDKYRQGKLDYKVLNLLENKVEAIQTELKGGRLTSQELMDLYSKKDGLEVEEFSKITEGYEFGDEALVDYLSDEITPEKVEALFSNYYISQDDLSILVSRNIITKEQAEKFAIKIATHEQYESIFALDNRYIVLTRETEGEPGVGGGHYHIGPGPIRPRQIKNDPELQELLLTQIGFDERTLVLQGTNNSLDGYRVYPSEDYGIMVFLKNDKPGNATYIMTLQQGLYFLNKIVRERKNQVGQPELGIQLQSDATKRELRETEHVKVRNASAGWGKNVVDVMRKLSPSFREKMNSEAEYKKTLDDVIEEIKEDYKARKDRDE